MIVPNRSLFLLLTSALVCTCDAQISTNVQEWMRRIESGEFRDDNVRGPRRGPRVMSRNWVDGGSGYTTIERDGDRAEIVRFDTATGRRTVLFTTEDLTPPGSDEPLRFSSYAMSNDKRYQLFPTAPRTVYITKTAHDFWLRDSKENTWRKLGGREGGDLLYAKLSPDNARAAWIRDNDLFAEDLHNGRIRRLTRDGSDEIINGTSDWVYEEEFNVTDAFEWSPDGRHIAYLQFDQSAVPEFTLINYTDELYPILTQYRYPKAGQANAAVRLGVVSASGGRTRWAHLPGDPRSTYIPRIGWADAEHVICQQLDRLQQTNRVWLVNARTGRAQLMFEDRDAAWVELHNIVDEPFTWIEHSSRLLHLSERDGWRHVYAVSRDGDVRQVTRGDFDVISVQGIDHDGGWIYFIASPDNATQRYLYRCALHGNAPAQRITPADAPGTHSYSISPDARWAFHSHSRFDWPGVSDLIRLPDHQVVRVFNNRSNLSERVAAVLSNRTEFVRVKVSDGTLIDGWLIKPTRFDPAKKYPIILYVYGEAAATTVNDSWSGTGRLLYAGLADDGYLIASFDNRGTPSPKGRQWRKIIYGSVGVLGAEDQAEALRALARTHPFVDLDRVGVFGWSGGGSMTLNLMFRFPELYKVGVAGAPVADQTLYDTIYQERYMGLPQDNPEGYRAGSPITHAGGLKGQLLIIHGTGDDNVHFQGTQRLLNRLIELNKQFHFMEYPNRRHGISGRHIDTLRYGFFQEHLPAGGR